LTVPDALLVEAAFRNKLAVLEDGETRRVEELTQNLTGALAHPISQHEKPGIVPSNTIGISRGRVLTKTVRLRDKEHRKFVSRQPCLVCGRTPTDAHHLRFAQPRALGLKVSDEFTVPVCRVHHRELHRLGDEAAWWQRNKIDPLPIANRLWRQARLPGSSVALASDTGPKPSTSANGAASADTDRAENLASSQLDGPASS
jgi:hypothetical protein